MNTTMHTTAARTAALVLLLCQAATAAFAQGPTNPLGGRPTADCPEAREAATRAEELRGQARDLENTAKYLNDQAARIEKNVRDARVARAAQEEAVAKSEARLERLRSGEVYATNRAAEIAKESATLAGYRAELDRMTKSADGEGELLAAAIAYRRLADTRRDEAAAKRAEADALVKAAARCSAEESARAIATDGPVADPKATKEKKPKKSVTKEKKEKKEKSHALRNGLFGAGIVLGTHVALGGWRRERVCTDRRP